MNAFFVTRKSNFVFRYKHRYIIDRFTNYQLLRFV